MNVRTAGPSESRLRGGTRSGLAKFCPTDLGNVTSLIPVTYVDADGDRQHDLVYVADGVLGYVRAGVATSPEPVLHWPDDQPMLWPDDQAVGFDATVSSGELQGVVRAGRIYVADSVLRTYDPDTGVVEDVVASEGVVPTGQTVIALYRDRIFLSGASQVWFCSRLGDPTDWDHGAAMEDTGRAVAGQLSDAGRVGAVVTAMIPVHDQALVLATENSLWVLRGDPTTGTLRNVSDELGVVSSRAWAMSPDGTVVFLSNDGIYAWRAGSQESPARFSAERVPDELLEVDTDANAVSMAYDPVERGYHLFVTPTGPTVGTHWWIDLENRALWPQRFQSGHQPLASALMSDSGLGDTVLAGKDGFLRYFVEGQGEDDSDDLESHVLIGPVRLAADDVRDALLAEIHGVVEDLTAGTQVTWRVVTGRSAAEATEAALADLDLVLDGQAPTSVAGSGTWTEGRGRVSRPRARGAWLVVWLSGTGAWSYEVVAVVARQLGRHR